MTPSADQPFKAQNVGDVFAMLPALFGFHPHESLVAIVTHGPRNRLGFRLRLDMPAEADIDAVAAQAAHYLRLQKPDGLLLLAVSADAEPAETLIRAIATIFDDVPILEAARGDGQNYWTCLCDSQPTYPSDGIDYGARCSPVVAEAIFRGESILPDRESLVRRFDGPTGQQAETMKRITEEVAQTVDRRCAGLEQARVAAVGMHQLMRVFARGMCEKFSDEEIALISVWCAQIPVRDSLWSRFDRESAADWLVMLTQVGQRVVAPYEPAVFSLLAFAAWLSGDGAQAAIAAERALRARTDYSFAQLILRLVHAGVAPDLWTGFDTARASAGR